MTHSSLGKNGFALISGNTFNMNINYMKQKKKTPLFSLMAKVLNLDKSLINNSGISTMQNDFM